MNKIDKFTEIKNKLAILLLDGGLGIKTDPKVLKWLVAEIEKLRANLAIATEALIELRSSTCDTWVDTTTTEALAKIEGSK